MGLKCPSPRIYLLLDSHSSGTFYISNLYPLSSFEETGKNLLSCNKFYFNYWYRMMLISSAGNPRWFEILIDLWEGCQISLFLPIPIIFDVFHFTDKRWSTGCPRIHQICVWYIWVHIWLEAIHSMLFAPYSCF